MTAHFLNNFFHHLLRVFGRWMGVGALPATFDERPTGVGESFKHVFLSSVRVCLSSKRVFLSFECVFLPSKRVRGSSEYLFQSSKHVFLPSVHVRGAFYNVGGAFEHVFLSSNHAHAPPTRVVLSFNYD